MAKGWYVVHVYSGHENKVEKQIRKVIDSKELNEFVFDVKIPSEEIAEIKDGKKKLTTKKFLPGYILIEMDLAGNRWKEVCSYIRRIQGVTGFVGYSANQKPQPISQEEARAILQKAMDIILTARGTQLCPDCVDLFVKLITEIPPEKLIA